MLRLDFLTTKWPSPEVLTVYWIGRYLLLLYAATPRTAPTLPWCFIFSRNDQAGFVWFLAVE